ncbi:MAG: phosphoribosylglycinamide formyltransferase [Lachnospiraceae bacterium]|nr:phosphoribosylglycinamide formyltransferase [Lachnospiraceae bacterium]
MLKIGVLVSGGGTNLQAIIDGIQNGDITNAGIEVVISNNPGAYALQRAKDNNIPAVCISPKSFDTRGEFNEALIAKIDEYHPDLIVLAGCMVVLPSELIKKYENRIINIHPALIPSFCGKGFYGLHVHEAVLERGVKLTGATVHFVDEGTDTGPIIIQKAVQVRKDDTPEILQKRVMVEAEWKIMPQAINLIANGKVKVENGIVWIDE